MKLNEQKMAWNEPGNKNQKPSWEGKENLSSLEGWFKKLNKKFSSGSNNDGSQDSDGFSMFWVAIIAGILLIIYVISGFFIVEPQEQGVVLQFGKYKKTVESGPHWIPRLIDSAIVLNVQGIQNYSYSANMLTRDENIVDVAVAVQYRIKNPENYLFNVENPLISLQQATASSLRQVIGNTNLDDILTSGREKVSQDVKEQLVEILDKYQTGLEITEVALQPAKAPDAVKDAFDDAIKAQEDEQRYINQAQAYKMQVIPQANGKKQRILADARAYKEQVVLNANGETARYLALLPEYQAHPVVTRERLYLSALQNIFTNSTKIFVDQKQGNNTLMYLPIDKLLSNSQVNTRLSQIPLALNAQQAQADTRNNTQTTKKTADNFSGYGSNQSTNSYDFLNEGRK